MIDEEVIELAIREPRIIITFDKDFERIALTKPNITRVVLLRIPPLNPQYIYRLSNVARTVLQHKYL